MVHIETYQKMQELLRTNLSQYILQHPGEFVLLETNNIQIVTSFYKDKTELERATKKYLGLYGPTFLVSKIPFEKAPHNSITIDTIVKK